MRYPSRIISLIFISILFIAVFPVAALATTASITASQDGLQITVNASATFTNYEYCDDQTPPNCTYDDTGTLSVYLDDMLQGEVTGAGTAEWSHTFNSFLWTNGTHTIKAVATDHEGVIHASETTVDIDYTPQNLTLTGPTNPTGPADFEGTVIFTENPATLGEEGRIDFYIDNQYYGRILVDQPMITFHWSDVYGPGAPPERPLNIAPLSQGVHTVKVVAVAANSAEATAIHEFNVDNTPTISITGPDNPTGPSDFDGTATFTENINFLDDHGHVDLYLDDEFYGTLSFPFDYSVSFKWSNILSGQVGALLNVAELSQGLHLVKAVAVAANGAEATAIHEFNVDNTPTVSISGPTNPTGPADFEGTFSFTESSDVLGEIGYLKFYLDDQYYGTTIKAFGVSTGTFRWSEVVSEPSMSLQMVNVAELSQGLHTVKVVAEALNGAEATAIHEFNVDNTPTISISGPTNPTGPADFEGTFSFTESSDVLGEIGYLKFYLDDRYYGTTIKAFGVSTGTFRWSEVVSEPSMSLQMVNVAELSQGLHTVKVVAEALNGAEATAIHEFNVDNTPTVSISGPTNPTGPADFEGTFSFTESSDVLGEIGYLKFYLDDQYYGTTIKAFGVSTGTFRWSEVVSEPSMSLQMVNVAELSQGLHTVKVVAEALNGAEATAIHEFSVDNTPTVSLTGPDAPTGPADFEATVTFTENSDVLVNNGHVDFYLDDEFVGTSYGYYPYEATITFHWSDIVGSGYIGSLLNVAELSQGLHTVKAVAVALNGSEATAIHEFNVDNTPTVSITGPTNPTGPADFDISFTFTDTSMPLDEKGHVDLYLDDQLYGTITFDFEPNGTFQWSDIITEPGAYTGKPVNVAELSLGLHTVKAVAVAANGAEATAIHEFNVDNTATVSITGPEAPVGWTDFTGTATFFDNPDGFEGTILIKLDDGEWASKEYEGTNIEFSWSEITESLLNASLVPNGDHAITVKAVAANDVEAVATHTFNVEMRPVISLMFNSSEEPMEIWGEVDFFDNPEGTDGKVYLGIDDPDCSECAFKECEGIGNSFTWSELYGSLLNVAVLSEGEHRIYVWGEAANGSRGGGSLPIWINNVPDVYIYIPLIVSGPINPSISGTFTENLEGEEGTVALYFDGVDLGIGETVTTRDYSTDWETLTGEVIDTGVLSNGYHTVGVLSTAINGAETMSTRRFYVDNTPIIKLNPPGDVCKTFDITATATFKEVLAGDNGTIYMSIDDPEFNNAESRVYNGTSVSFSWSGLSGDKLNASSFSEGVHTVYIKAVSYNESEKLVSADFYVGPADSLCEIGTGNTNLNLEQPRE